MCPMLFIRTKISLSYNFKNLKKYFLSCNLTNFCSERMWYNKGFTERKPFSSFWKEVCQAGWLSLLLGKVCDSALHTIKSHINATYWSYCRGGWLRRTLHKCYLIINTVLKTLVTTKGPVNYYVNMIKLSICLNLLPMIFNQCHS